MNHGSLFSGIGGFDLAAEWMGWNNVFHCEWNEYAQKILKQHFPKSITYGDITKTNFAIHRGSIDILTGGFPCQPYSAAGKRKGKEDERHLWPEMLRTIREIKPRWIVGENVSGIITWNAGMVFNEVQAELEAEGYEVQAYVLPAISVNASHRRDRVWFIAHTESERLEKENKRPEKELVLLKKTSMVNDRCFTTEWVDRCPDNGTIRNNDGIPYFMDRIKACGNAIVPQVAHQIFRAIAEYENLYNESKSTP